jgi:hypothetical protein
MAIANITNNILTDSGVATSSLLPLTGGTLTGGLIGQNATFDGNVRVGTLIGSLEVGYASAIGTHKLDVNGTGRFTNNANTATLNLLNNNSFPSIINMSTTTATSTARNWAIFTNGTNWGDLEFKPSAANGGDPYTTGTVALRLASTGAATFSSSVTATSFFESSDSRLKTLIQDNYQTKGIASITPKLYTKNGKVELGYYAQDFVGVLDSAVSKGSDDMLSLSYREVLVAKVYALEQRIKELETK